MWAGVDNVWEQEKLEARKILENAAESHTSGARFVGRRIVAQDSLTVKEHAHIKHDKLLCEHLLVIILYVTISLLHQYLEIFYYFVRDWRLRFQRSDNLLSLLPRQ